MNNTKSDFEKRKNEIEIYFSFLLKIDDEENTKLSYKLGTNIVTEKVSSQLNKILIANSFLILYNLIESTVRNSIIEIFNQIMDDDIAYEKLSENFKNILIKQTTNKLKEGNYRPDTIQSCIYGFVSDALDKKAVFLNKEDINISGNLDAQEIRSVAKKYGFKAPKNGRNLEDIKNKRNKLAHGDNTFFDIGKNYSVNQLIAFKEEVVNYLGEMITKIEKFIEDTEYLNETSINAIS